MKLISCETCQHRVEANAVTQECHRNPPVALMGYMHRVESHWPRIGLGDRCGEWTPLEPPQ